jgi:DNA helicase-4
VEQPPLGGCNLHFGEVGHPLLLRDKTDRTAVVGATGGVGMSNWGPSWWGRLFTRSDDWRLQVDAESIRVTRGSNVQEFELGDRVVQVEEGAWWASVSIATGGDPVVLGGLPNGRSDALRVAFGAALVERDRLSGLAGRFTADCADILAWRRAMARELAGWQSRWVTREFVHNWVERRPEVDSNFPEILTKPRHQALVDAQPAGTRDAIDLWQSDLQAHYDARNESFLRDERNRYQEFFRTIESSPLTDEQVKAVVCLDNRVQVIAAAGSGKTSTMVAKAGYVLKRGTIPAERILMLAYNTDAAEELAARVNARLTQAGIPGPRPVAKTFHSFGLSVVGEATDHKPRLARKLEENDGRQRVQDIVDVLRDTSGTFRASWDLFRMVFGRDLPAFGQEDEPEDWDPVSKNRGYRTFQGELVKSQEERMIANWLFYQGVTYVYEGNYEHRTADPAHGQYRPDFYYPDIDAYHEHWALNAQGKPPPQFENYLDGVRWKKETHRAFGTTLLETTSASVRDGSAFTYLEEELTGRGVKLDPNPYRDVPGKPPVTDDDLVKTIRTFMIHVKSNRLGPDDLEDRIGLSKGSPLRTRMFLGLFRRIFDAWQAGLREANEIDFEDMLNLAIDHIEAGRWTSPYDLVMVDEMQDASLARSRMAAALVAKPGRFLFAVGDDWQSINRFAGADLSAMNGFQDWFGEPEILRLERTFRSPQSICDVSGAFVSKNPAQLTKHVRSNEPEFPPAMRAVVVDTDRKYAAAITAHLAAIDRAIATGAVPKGRRGPATVFILGRYRRMRGDVQPVLDREWSHLSVRFSTIHGSKGLEADYVVVPGLVAGGFPSKIEDDPLLAVAMPAGDTFLHAEERRLLYVALTRTRRSVLLVSINGRESSFLLELVRDGHVGLETVDGEPIEIIPCRCGSGRMVRRTGRNGDFLGCNRFPKCRETRNLATPARRRSSR